MVDDDGEIRLASRQPGERGEMLRPHQRIKDQPFAGQCREAGRQCRIVETVGARMTGKATASNENEAV
jgi:hypothetical protein